MNRTKLASILAKREGKKSSVRIGDIREILRLLIELDVEALRKGEPGPLNALIWEADQIHLGEKKFPKPRKKSKRA